MDRIIAGVLLTIITLMIAYVINSYIINTIEFLASNKDDVFLWRTIYTILIAGAGFVAILILFRKGSKVANVGVKDLAETAVSVRIIKIGSLLTQGSIRLKISVLDRVPNHNQGPTIGGGNLCTIRRGIQDVCIEVEVTS